METHPKKRFEVFIELPMLRRFTEIMEAEGIIGYSALPVVGGNGKSGHWSRGGVVTDAGQMVCVVCILSEEKLEPFLEKAFAVLSKRIAIVSITDCEVIRKDRF